MDAAEIEKLKKTAEEHILAKKYLHAAQIYHRLLDETNSMDFKFRLAEIYLHMGFIDASDKYYVSVLEDFPDNDEMRMEISSLLMHNGNWEKLIEVLSLVDSDKKPEVNLILGVAYLKTKDYKFAKHYLEKFLKSDNNPELKMEAGYYLGITDYYQNNFDSAIKKFKESEFHQNNNSDFYFYLASSYRMLGMFTHASLYITKALRLNKKDIRILLEAAKIYNKLEQFKKANKYLDMYSELSKRVPNDYLLTLAETYLGLKHAKEAEMVISLIDEDESDNPEVIAIKSRIQQSLK
ncbi:tetratricopeptide repeat protein [Ignavibacterium album]|uniref:tetratricopeptide repeat protein n=1 Tax=Ignavibacterium album TaxID=591197 RepID=UPI0035B895B1